MMRKTWVLAAAVVLSAAAATGGVVALSGGKQATAAPQDAPVGSRPAYSNTGAGGSTNVTTSPKEQSDAFKFAQCMRENGVKDFPDPVAGERLIDASRLRSQIPSSGTPGGMSILHAAMQKCAVTSWERQWGG
jgi:hypothetical protein